MANYPGSNYTENSSGTVKVFEDKNDLWIKMNMVGVAPNCSPAETQKNGCGVHIHAGTTCSDAAQVGDHYFNPNIFSTDPWVSIRYNSNSAGRSEDYIHMVGGNGYDLNQNKNRAMVIHDANGTRISCGLLY